MYSGPSVSVLSSNITSSQFTAQLKLSNATTWIGNGRLNINSDNAGVIWAYGTNAPNNPSNPSSDFQQHRVMGVFSIDMKSAQVNQDSPSSTNPAGGATATALAPTITGNLSPEGTGIGLTHRDKVARPQPAFRRERVTVR